MGAYGPYEKGETTMRDVSEKVDTFREAAAEAHLSVGPVALAALREGRVPKGNAFEMARAAGILAAKRTSEIIPLCHPVPLDWVDLEFEIKGGGILITSRAKALWRTGVEMEALTAASVAALTIYDMLKPMDDDLEISFVRLVEKHGGMGDFEGKFEIPISAAVLMISDAECGDEAHQKAELEKMVEILRGQGVEADEYRLIDNDFDAIRAELKELSDRKGVHMVFTVGGGGIKYGDVGVQATKDVMERELTGLEGAIRRYRFRRDLRTVFSMGIAGIRGKTVLMTIPDGPEEVERLMRAVLPWLLGAIRDFFSSR